MKKLRNIKGFLRYIISYLLVLLLPLSAFLLFSNQYMLSVYKQEILQQSQSSFAKLQSTTDNRVEQMTAIAGQLSSVSYVKTKEALGTEYLYNNVRALLGGHTSTHTFLDSITFYSALNPDTVYTDKGTYSLHYYKHYGRQDLSQKLSGLTGAAWWVPSGESGSEAGGRAVLEYAVPVPDRISSYVVFTMQRSSFAQTAEEPDTQTFLYDKEGQLLYAPDGDEDLARALWEKAEAGGPAEYDSSHYLLASFSKSGIAYIRLISKQVVFSKLDQIQRLITMMLMIISIIGGSLAYLMAFFNYRPIKKLDRLVAERPDSIPKNLYGAERVSFVLKRQDERYASLERSALRERILYKLIHGRVADRASFETECGRAGLVFTSPCMRAVLLYFNQSQPASARIDVVCQAEQILSEPYEVCGMEYMAGRCYLLLVGYEQENPDILKNHLLTLVSFLSQYTRDPVKISAGAPCGSLFEIYRSYNQAMSVTQSGVLINSVLLYEETSSKTVNFVYPKIELDTLFNAIVNGENEKVKLLLDILSDMIGRNRGNRFIVVSLGYDIINTCLRAVNDVKSGYADQSCYVDSASLCELRDADSFLEAISEMKERIEKLICLSSSRQDKNSAPQKIVEYINRNYQKPELCVSFVADHFAMSISNLSHQFKAQTGLNISEYIAEKQLDFAKKMLRSTDISIGDAAARLGYNQTSSFIRKFKKYEKMTPNEYRLLYRTKGEEKAELKQSSFIPT